MNRKKKVRQDPSIKTTITIQKERRYDWSGEHAIIAVCRLQPKGRGGKAFLNSMIMKPQLENGIDHFKIIASSLGGPILLVPFSGYDALKELEEAKRTAYKLVEENTKTK